jgi:tetratricopeptide (TPR) repeat protein
MGYMPSEQVNGNPGFYSDIYAVGIIAVQALTRLDPSRNQLPRDPQTGEIAWRNRVSVSPGLARIVDRMVRSHFRERYQTVGEVLKDIQNLRSSAATLYTVNLQTPVQKAPSSTASAEISALPSSNRGRSVTPLQVGATLAVVGAFLMLFKLLSSTQTASQQSSKAPITSANITSGAANFLNQGNQLRDLGQHEKALAAYDKAIAIKPDYLEASWSRCYAFNQLQRYEEALAACDEALKIKPDYYNAWWSKGYALDELQRYQEALAAYDRALKIKPDFPETWNNRGTALNCLRRYKEALASYEKALELKPDYSEAWNNRGVVLAKLRRFKEAMACYEKAIQLKPDYQPAIKNRKRLLQVLGH